MDFKIVWGRWGEEQSVRRTLKRFPIWEIKNMEKSAFRTEEPGYFLCYVHTRPFLEFEWFLSRPVLGFTNLQVLPTSFLTAVRIFHNFPHCISWPHFHGPAETEQLPRADWLSHAQLSFCTVIGCCSSRTRPQRPQPWLDSSALLLWQKVDPEGLR